MDELIALGMNRGLLEKFLDELSDELDGGRECDHTARHALAWLRRRGLDADAIHTVLKSSGGYCDCEIVLNVDPQCLFPDRRSPEEKRREGLARSAKRPKSSPPPKLDVFDDGVIRVPIPKKPWRLRTPNEGEVLRCAFGAG